MQIMSSFYLDVETAKAVFLRTWKNDPLRRQKKKEGWVGEKGSFDLHYSKCHECQIKEEQESSSHPLKDFSSFFRAIDLSRANPLKHWVMPLTSQNSHLILAEPHVVCFQQLRKAETAKVMLCLGSMKDTQSWAQKWKVCIFCTRCCLSNGHHGRC